MYLSTKRRELEDDHEFASLFDEALETEKASFELLRVVGASRSAKLNEIMVDSVLAFPTSLARTQMELVAPVRS